MKKSGRKKNFPHAQNGYCPPEKRHYHDIRDALLEEDRLVDAFLAWHATHGNTQDAIAILGDHFFHGPTPFVEKEEPRTLYNAFLGNIPPLPPGKRAQAITAVDIAPTLRHCTGARWGHDRFGIGVSLFAPGPSLRETLGDAALRKGLEQYSPFFSDFY